MRRPGVVSRVVGSTVAGAVALAGAVWLPAYAADDRPPKIGRKDLPTTAQVAEVYPELAGGERYVTRGGRSLLLPAGEDCVQTTELARADRGTRANYFLEGGLDPYEQGFDDPTVHGWRFDSVGEAKAVIDAVADYAERCVGSHGDAEAHTTTLSRLDDPGHGDESIALRTEVTWPDDGDGASGYTSLDLLVRDGLSISRVLVKAESSPDVDPAMALSRMAWRRLR